MEQEQAFRVEALESGALEGAWVEKDYSIRVDKIRWLRPGEATILSDQFFLDWLMYREEDVECAGPGRRFVASHAVLLVPPGPEVRNRLKVGRLRPVSCRFPPEKERTRVDAGQSRGVQVSTG